MIRGEDGLERGEYFDPTSNMKFTIQVYIYHPSSSIQIEFNLNEWNNIYK